MLYLEYCTLSYHIETILPHKLHWFIIKQMGAKQSPYQCDITIKPNVSVDTYAMGAWICTSVSSTCAYQGFHFGSLEIVWNWDDTDRMGQNNQEKLIIIIIASQSILVHPHCRDTQYG